MINPNIGIGALQGRGAFGLTQEDDPLLRMAMQSPNQSQLASQQAAAQQQAAISQVGSILNNVLQQTQQPQPMGMNLANPSGFGQPQQAPAPEEQRGPMSPTGQLAQKFGQPSAPSQSAPQQGAFPQQAPQPPMEQPSMGQPPAGQPPTGQSNGAFGQPQAGAPQMDPNNPLGSLLESATQAIGAAGGPGAAPQNTDQVLQLAQAILPQMGVNADLSTLQGTPEGSAIAQKAMELAQRLHGGGEAIAAQEAANPGAMQFLRQAGFGNFIDQTKRRGAF